MDWGMIGAPGSRKDGELVRRHVKKTDVQITHLWMGICDGCRAPRVDEPEKGDGLSA